MTSLEDRVLRTIRRYALAGPSTGVLAAVSGGPDSVALLGLLRALATAREFRLVGIVHFNHQLREEADAEERFCRELAAGAGLPFLSDGADVRELARQGRRSLEDAARTARHAFFERARGASGADVVATGHTRDDQAETFLLRLLRGAGSEGLASMHPRNGIIVRPLLWCRRDELAGYLAARCLPFVHDRSNDDVAIPRNRVRAELMPLIRDRFNPSIVDALADSADLAREESAWLNQAAADLEARLVILTPTDPAGATDPETGSGRQQVAIDTSVLNAAAAAVARAALRRLMTRMAGGRFIGFDAVERARALSRVDGSGFDAPGQRVQRIGSTLVLTGRPLAARGRPAASWPAVTAYRHPLPIPGLVELPPAGVVISAEDGAGFTMAHASSAEPTLQTAIVRRDLCGTLMVRNRLPGDRFRPLGMAGHKKLQDFFVDRKVARHLRDRIPLVVDEADRIVWVAGHAVSDDFRVTDPAQAVIILRLKGVGGAV